VHRRHHHRGAAERRDPEHSRWLSRYRFVFGTVDTPECHSRQFWSEPMVIALPDSHPLAGNEALTWDELAGETFLIRHFSTTSQLYAISCGGLPSAGTRHRSGPRWSSAIR
jgi:DNA-binding transcriptional LysR family regulator